MPRPYLAKHDPRLDDIYTLASNIASADPASFPVLVQTLPNIRAQMECSDVVILNKTDLFDGESMERIEFAICAIKPGVPILRTRYCEA